MPKKRVSADKKAGIEDEDMYNLPLIPQREEKVSSAQLPAAKKKKSEKLQQLLPAPESESDEDELVPSDADRSSEDNDSNDDELPARDSGSSSKEIVHDKR